MKKQIRLKSRIHEHLSESVLKELDKICMNKLIPDNNTKVDMMIDVLNRNEVDHTELGPGTNRLAVLIEGYVFKIALDTQGKRDNTNEFKIAYELQPYVSRTYETNDLICVHEYVTVISKEEFIDNTETIRAILSILAENYLLGDVGTVPKNFCNWGFRDDGQLVILDYAHLYRISPQDIMCELDATVLAYDQNFHNLICPQCGRKYPFMYAGRRITLAQETQENLIAKELSYKLNQAVQVFTEEDNSASEYIDSGQPVHISLYNGLNEINNNEEESSVIGYDNEEIDERDEEDVYNETLEELLRAKEQPAQPDGRPLNPDESISILRHESAVSHDGNNTVTTTKTDILNVNDVDKTRIQVYSRSVESDQTEPEQITEVEAEVKPVDQDEPVNPDTDHTSDDTGSDGSIVHKTSVASNLTETLHNDGSHHVSVEETEHEEKFVGGRLVEERQVVHIEEASSEGELQTHQQSSSNSMESMLERAQNRNNNQEGGEE